MAEETVHLTKADLISLWDLLQKPLPAGTSETVYVGRFAISRQDLLESEYRHSIATITRDARRQQAIKYYQKKRSSESNL